jgi:hypothetical protein
MEVNLLENFHKINMRTESIHKEVQIGSQMAIILESRFSLPIATFTKMHLVQSCTTRGGY